MCLFVKYPESKNRGLRTAKEKKIAYKVFKVTKNRTGYYLVSPYRGTVWKNKQMGVQTLTLTDGFYPIVSEGIHAFTSKRRAYEEQQRWSVPSIVEMIIPKGTTYVLGINQDIVATKMRIKRMPTQRQLKKIYENRKIN